MFDAVGGGPAGPHQPASSPAGKPSKPSKPSPPPVIPPAKPVSPVKPAKPVGPLPPPIHPVNPITPPPHHPVTPITPTPPGPARHHVPPPLPPFHPFFPPEGPGDARHCAQLATHTDQQACYAQQACDMTGQPAVCYAACQAMASQPSDAQACVDKCVKLPLYRDTPAMLSANVVSSALHMASMNNYSHDPTHAASGRDLLKQCMTGHADPTVCAMLPGMQDVQLAQEDVYFRHFYAPMPNTYAQHGYLDRL